MGVGESTVDDESVLVEATFDDYVDHAVAWLKYLESEHTTGPLGVIGHSEGSLIGLLAAKAFPIDFAISVAGNGDPIDRQLVKQVGRFDSEAAPILEQRLAEIANSVYRKTDNLLVDSLVPLGRERYLQTWMAYDPSEVLRSLDMPVLVVWGDHDERLVGEDDLFRQDNMPDAVKFVEIQQMGHLLRWAETDEDLVQAYKNRNLPLHDQFIDTVLSFIKEQNKGDQ
jgi:pimeloyl-ACP methyl ester carboxylesterase